MASEERLQCVMDAPCVALPLLGIPGGFLFRLRFDFLDLFSDFLGLPLQLVHMLADAGSGRLVPLLIEFDEILFEGCQQVAEFLEPVHRCSSLDSSSEP
jgi:hypothetical protein